VSGGMSLMYEPHSFIHGRTDRQTDKTDGQDGWMDVRQILRTEFL